MNMSLLVVGLWVVFAVVLWARAEPTSQPATRPTSVLDFTVTDNIGRPVDLSSYRGQVLLIVNTASQCGLTPQYAGLQKLYETHKEQGLAVLAFPANEFGQQEPGTNEEIREFCTTHYGVNFDLFSKIIVKGEGQAPLYRFLTQPQTNPQFAGEIQWNFTKFLISRDGQVVARFEPAVAPDDPKLTAAVEAELARQPG